MSAALASPGRQVALAVLRRVRTGAYADRALMGEARRAGLRGQDRAQAHRLAFGAVQRMRTLDWAIDAKIRNPADLEPDVRDVLRLATFELGWSDAVPGPVAVDQAVRLVATLPGDARRARARRGLVNAVARALSRDLDSMLAGLADGTWQEAALRHSVPDWMARELFGSLGPEDAVATLVAANEPAESIVRWNPAGGSRAAFEALLPDGAVRCSEPFGDSYRLDGPFALEESELWSDGRGMAQSRASLLPVLALDPRPGERVLDLCAAPGAKTTALAASVGPSGQVVAVELNPKRADALRDLSRRLHVSVEVVEADGRHVDPGRDFDAVLVDPPCSGLGVLASRPDARWRRREEDVDGLVRLQLELLQRSLELVAPAGRVVYSTCTLSAAENERLVGGFADRLEDLGARFPQFADPVLPRGLRTLPGRDGTDGFFVARLRGETTR